MKDRILTLICTAILAVFGANVAYYCVCDVGLVPVCICVAIVVALESVYSVKNVEFSWIGLTFHLCAFLCFFYIAYSNGTLFQDVAYRPQGPDLAAGLYHKPADFGCGVSPAWQWWLFVGLICLRIFIIQPVILFCGRRKTEN